MKQYRGCSHLYRAAITYGEGGTITYGAPHHVCACKTVSRDITDDKEPVFADNELQDETHGATKIARTFSVMRLGLDEENALYGGDEITVSGTKKAYATPPDASLRPEYAWGYALHDGDPETPCEVVWAYRGKVASITKTANTIADDTGSEGQEITIDFLAPKAKFTATGKKNLDFNMPISSENASDAETWFVQVVTPDNVGTIFNPTPPTP